MASFTGLNANIQTNICKFPSGFSMNESLGRVLINFLSTNGKSASFALSTMGVKPSSFKEKSALGVVWINQVRATGKNAFYGSAESTIGGSEVFNWE